MLLPHHIPHDFPSKEWVGASGYLWILLTWTQCQDLALIIWHLQMARFPFNQAPCRFPKQGKHCPGFNAFYIRVSDHYVCMHRALDQLKVVKTLI